MGQEMEEFVEKLNNDFSASSLAKLLMESGLTEVEIRPEIVPFNQFVFLRSKSDEIYGAQERSLIRRIGNVFLFPEFRKNSTKGVVPCCAVAVDLQNIGADVHTAVLFMKTVLKAYDGWMIFIIRMEDGIHIGIRTYEREAKNNCTLCESMQVPEILDDLAWCMSVKDFLPFYAGIFELINPVDTNSKDYDELAIRRRGVQYGYIESLEDISKRLQVDLSYAIREYRKWFDEDYSYSFVQELDDALEALKDVKSTRVNTLEMLFEAEELEKMAADSEEKYQQTLSSIEAYDEDRSQEAAYMSGKDPEEMIKLLKERKGIL